MEKVLIKRSALETLLHLARAAHPKETVVLLRGKVKGDIFIEEVLLAPLASAGEDFSEFPMDALPLDPSIVSIAHSHPVRGLEPSEEDLNESYGRVSVIVTHPYRSASDVAAYSSTGKRLRLQIV